MKYGKSTGTRLTNFHPFYCVEAGSRMLSWKGYIHLKIHRCLKFALLLFFNALAKKGEPFFKNICCQLAKTGLVDQKWTKKSTLFPRLAPVFGNFENSESNFQAFLKVDQELFMKYLGIVFGLKGSTFGCIFISIG